MSEPGPLRTLIVVAAIAAGSAVFLSAANEFSRERIARNEQERLRASLDTVLDPSVAALGLEAVELDVRDPERLGVDGPIDVFVMLEGETAKAYIFATVAPGGYNGPIDLLVGISPDGRLSGVRVLNHRETPGLGDAIEIGKSDWILQFDGKSIEDPEPEGWQVDKDGGEFDSLTGATVTPRAVVDAIHRTLAYLAEERETLRRAAVGAMRDRNAASEAAG